MLTLCALACLPLMSFKSGGVERQETAREQLTYAAQLRQLHQSAHGKAREAAREATVKAYEAVHEYYPRALEEGAEAYFRAGELQRAAGELKEALRLFEAATRVSPSTAVCARAMLQCGHVQRRLSAFRKALASYEKVMRDKHAAPKYRDRATFWKARVFLLMHREEDARRVFRGLVNATEDPLTVVRVYDELVLSAVREGDLEWAAGIIEECRSVLEDPLREETDLGRRVRNAFRHMRCRARLKEAIIERRRARMR